MPITIDVVNNNTENYGKVCNFVKKRYQEDLKANIQEFPPIFLIATNERKEIISCLGLTPASYKKPLMVEKYFDFHELNLFDGNLNNRNCFGEMGTFTTEQKYRDYDFFLMLITMFLQLAASQGLRYILLTAIKPVQFILKRLGVPLISIGQPNKNKLSKEEQNLWNAFFNAKPYSFAIDIANALSEIQKREQKSLEEFIISPKLAKII